MAYTNTFIIAADDCPVSTAQNPSRGKDTLTRAEIEYNLLTQEPYSCDHLDFTYLVHNRHKAQSGATPQSRHEFHAKGQPCMRASALVKRYGYGAHYNSTGKIAIYPMESPTYKKFSESNATTVLKGMRNKRA